MVSLILRLEFTRLYFYGFYFNVKINANETRVSTIVNLNLKTVEEFDQTNGLTAIQAQCHYLVKFDQTNGFTAIQAQCHYLVTDYCNTVPILIWNVQN